MEDFFFSIDEDETVLVSLDPALRNMNVTAISKRQKKCLASTQVDLLQYHTPKPGKKVTTYKNKYCDYDVGHMVHSFVYDFTFHKRWFRQRRCVFVIERTNIYSAVVKKITVVLYHVLCAMFGFDAVFYSNPSDVRRFHGIKVSRSDGQSEEARYSKRKRLSIDKCRQTLAPADFAAIVRVLGKTGVKARGEEDGADACEAILQGVYFLHAKEPFAAPVIRVGVDHPTVTNIRLDEFFKLPPAASPAAPGHTCNGPPPRTRAGPAPRSGTCAAARTRTTSKCGA